MNLLTVAVAGFMGIVTAIFVISLFVAIIFNLRSAEKYRYTLARKLNDLRMGNMLKALGIDANSYLHSERIIEIQKQMARCSECENTDICDDRLSKEEVSPSNIGFCNNEKDLQKLTDKQSVS